MSKLKQYIVFGGLLFLFQMDSVKRIFQSPSFLNTVLGGIGILLVIAVIITISAQKRQKKQKENEDDRASIL
ncbi:MAG: hypothetical protein ACI4TE_07350 [Alphaproteobacteria bacterium]